MFLLTKNPVIFLFYYNRIIIIIKQAMMLHHGLFLPVFVKSHLNSGPYCRSARVVLGDWFCIICLTDKFSLRNLLWICVCAWMLFSLYLGTNSSAGSFANYIYLFWNLKLYFFRLRALLFIILLVFCRVMTTFHIKTQSTLSFQSRM